jgi:8-oxo-dGTP pyrophosphatase MutT (NUDIX family)
MSDRDVERRQVDGLPRHVVGVSGAVLDDDGLVLLVQRREPRRWELPGGALELGERLLDGLAREVEEETGLLVEPLRLTGVYQNLRLGPVALTFACRVLGGTPRVTDETSDWRWAGRDDVPHLMPPARAARALDALDALAAVGGVLDGLHDGGVPLRVHDGSVLLPGGLPSP